MAVPVIENSTLHTEQTNDSSFSHTGTGSDLLAVVMVSQRYGAAGGIVGVTYGGTSMTLAKSTSIGMAYIFYLLNAPSGSQTVAVDVVAGSVGRPYRALALTITGAKTFNPINIDASYSGSTDNTITVDIATTIPDCLILDVLGTTSGTDPTASGSGHTSLFDGTYSLGIYGFGYIDAATAATYTPGWTTTSQNNDFGLAAVAIAPDWEGPTFVSAGAIAEDLTGGASVTPTPPTHQADDILVVASYNAAGDAMSTVTSGWTSFNNIAGTDDIAFFWKRATGAGTAGPTITAAGTDCFAICYVFRNCVTSGTPFEDATNSGDGTTAETTPDSALITTTDTNRLAVCIVAHDDDTTFSSGNPPTGWTDGTNNTTSSGGTQVGFNLICKTIPVAGDVSAVVVGTLGASELYGAVTLALLPTSAVVSSIKTVNGLAKASVKTVNGLAIASVKTINGLA